MIFKQIAVVAALSTIAASLTDCQQANAAEQVAAVVSNAAQCVAAPLALARKGAALVPSPPSVIGARMEHAVDRRMMKMLKVAYAGKGIDFSDHVLVNLEKRDKEFGWSGMYVEPVALRELSGGVFALVANAMRGTEHGRSAAHADGGVLGVVLLRKQSRKWKVERHFENVATLGSNGYIGEVSWISLADCRPGIAVLNGMTGQGDSEGSLALFDLTGGEMHDLADGLRVLSTDRVFCEDETSECMTIESKWHFETNAQSTYDDLVIDFFGFRERRKDGAADTVPRVRTTVASQARYSFKDGTYKLVTGEDVLPKFDGAN